MNIGPDAPVAEIVIVAQIIVAGLVVVAAFAAGWFARGRCV